MTLMHQSATGIACLVAIASSSLLPALAQTIPWQTMGGSAIPGRITPAASQPRYQAQRNRQIGIVNASRQTIMQVELSTGDRRNDWRRLVTNPIAPGGQRMQAISDNRGSGSCRDQLRFTFSDRRTTSISVTSPCGDFQITVRDNRFEIGQLQMGNPSSTTPTPTTPTPPAPTSPTTPNGMTQEILAAHNKYRAQVGVPALTWSSNLATHAQQWANHLASQGGRLVHSQGQGEGENLWGGTAGAFGYTQMVDMWGGEKQYFRAGTFPNVSSTGNWAAVGHYTQMIWRNTTQVGCATARGGSNDVLVCRYSPAGNVMGQRVY